IGVALAIDPSASNMGYVALALDPQFRAKPEYLQKSGAVEAATVRVDPLGRVVAVLSTAAQGQGHRHAVTQIMACKLCLAVAACPQRWPVVIYCTRLRASGRSPRGPIRAASAPSAPAPSPWRRESSGRSSSPTRRI